MSCIINGNAIMSGYNWLLIIFYYMYGQVSCKDCEPKMNVQPLGTVKENGQQFLNCFIRDQTACIDNLEYVLYEKELTSWLEVCRVDVFGNLTTNELPDGYSLGNRSTAENVYEEYRLVINPTHINDSGNWRCVVQEQNDERHESMITKVNISTILKNDDLNLTIPPEIVLGTPASYTCRSDRVYPNASVQWEINEFPESGSTQFVPNGIAFDISNTISHIFMNRKLINVKCEFYRDDLVQPAVANASAENVTKIYAPATIDDHSLFPSTPNLEDTLTLSCTASGTNAYINWFHKDDPINMDLFTPKLENITGNFTFGEETAHKSTLTWLPPAEPTCENVNTHNGEYKCRSKADRGIQVSQTLGTVDVQYPPLKLTESNCDRNATVGETVEIEVETCSNPTARYTWTSMDGHHDISINTGDTIQFQVKDNDTIICNVTNSYGCLETKCTIFAIELETTPTDPSTTPVDTTTVDPGEPKSPNQALVTAFAVIWSLCGVFAILLICLAVYHYRQIQNGNKYKGEYSEEIVLTEDEAQPGTSHGSGVYDDISPAVVAKGSKDGAVGGINNDGLYAEVQRPAQTQMPVAPKRSSKIPASQPNPGTPKTKRNQAPAAPKSPINTRHQPNSPPTGRRPEPKAEYSPVSKRKEIQPQHPNESNRGPASKTEQQQKRHESPNKTADVKQTTNSAKPSIPFKPNITSVRSSRAPYDNAEVNLYANCDQRPVQKNADETVTYADLDLRKEDAYDEGAPPVPVKNMTDQEPVQYASIKHNK